MSLLALATGFFWLVLAYVMAGWLLQAARRPQRNGSSTCKDFTEASVWLGYLLNSGLDNGFIQFIHKRSGRFLRFRKHIAGQGDHRIALDIPSVGWRDGDIAMLRAYCNAHDLALETAAGDRADGIDRILVDCGNAAGQAYDLALEIWTKVFHARTKTTHRRDVAGVSIENPWIRILDWLFMVSVIALPAAMLLTIGASPDWSTTLGPVSLNGPMPGLIVFGAYMVLLPLSAFRRGPLYLTQNAILRRYDFGRRLIALVLPVVVILIWAGVLDATEIAIDLGGGGPANPADAAAFGSMWAINSSTILGAIATGFLWVVLAVLVTGLVLLVARPCKDAGIAQDRLFPKMKQRLNELLLGGDDGIHLLITHGQSDRFIRFRKYRGGDGGDGIILAFTDIGGSNELSSLQSYCEKHGLPVSATVLAGAARTPCFQIDCGRNLDRATRIARRVWREIFGLAATADYDSRIGHSPRDGVADRTGFRLSRLRERLANAAPYAFLISLAALPVATLLSIGEPPDWSLIGASGSATSLACFVFYLISLVTWIGCKQDRDPEVAGSQVPRRAFVSIALPLIILLLPLSVVLVWAGV